MIERQRREKRNQSEFQANKRRANVRYDTYLFERNVSRHIIGLEMSWDSQDKTEVEWHASSNDLNSQTDLG